MATTILLVADECDERSLHRLNLEVAGHRVVAALDGRDALEQARKEQPDVILVDVSLLAVDGWRVLGVLQQSGSVDVPVVILSESTDECDELRARDLGTAAYVAKPVCADDLLATLERVLAQRATTIER